MAVDVFTPAFVAQGPVVAKHTVTRPDGSTEEGFVVGVMADADQAKAVADALNFTERAGLFLIHVASELRNYDTGAETPKELRTRLANEIEEFTCG